MKKESTFDTASRLLVTEGKEPDPVEFKSLPKEVKTESAGSEDLKFRSKVTSKNMAVGKFYALSTRGGSDPDTVLFVMGIQSNGHAAGILYSLDRNKSKKASFKGFNLSSAAMVDPKKLSGGIKANMARKLDSGKSFEDYGKAKKEAGQEKHVAITTTDPGVKVIGLVAHPKAGAYYYYKEQRGMTHEFRPTDKEKTASDGGLKASRQRFIKGLRTQAGQSENDVKAILQQLHKKAGLMKAEGSDVEFYAFYNKKKYVIKADSLYAAKKKAIEQLKVPRSKQGLLSIMSKKAYDNQEFRYA
jgi:hypothetical protein